jgi:hypothetical protein
MIYSSFTTQRCFICLIENKAGGYSTIRLLTDVLVLWAKQPLLLLPERGVSRQINSPSNECSKSLDVSISEFAQPLPTCFLRLVRNILSRRSVATFTYLIDSKVAIY